MQTSTLILIRMSQDVLYMIVLCKGKRRNIIKVWHVKQFMTAENTGNLFDKVEWCVQKTKHNDFSQNYRKCVTNRGTFVTFGQRYQWKQPLVKSISLINVIKITFSTIIFSILSCGKIMLQSQHITLDSLQRYVFLYQ